MKLPVPPAVYDASRETAKNNLLERADLQNRKLNSDVEIAGSERLILSSPDGTRWKITVSNAGVLSATAL